MTVPTTARRAGPFNGNGVATSFPFTFKVFTSADVQVVKTSTAGVDTTLVLDTDYTVALNPDQDATPGGTITYPISGTPLATGEKLSAVGATDYDQQLDLSGGGKFDPTVIENALDRQVFQIQQLAEKIDRTLLVSVATPTDVDTTLPAPESNKLIGWNLAGDGLQNMDPATLATIVAFGTAIPDIFTGDGVTTAFTLTANPAALGNLDVAVGGVTQLPGTDYFWASGTSLTFAAAPANGVKILVRYIQALPQGSTDSAASSFVQSGSGAVVRDSQSKMRDVVSVMDFGAVGDGSTDDTSAILKAFDTQKTVYFPYTANGYKISATLTIKGDVICDGFLVAVSGFASTCVQFADPGYGARRVVRGLKVVATSARTSGSMGIKVNYPSIVLDRCHAQAFDIGIQVTSYSVQLLNCNAELCKTNLSAYAPASTSEINDLKVVGGNYDSATEYSCRIGDPRYATTVPAGELMGTPVLLLGASFDGATSTFDRIYGLTIQSCYWEGPANSKAIELGGAGDNWMRTVTIGGCYFSNVRYAIYCNSPISGLKVRANYYGGNTYCALYAVKTEYTGYEYESGSSTSGFLGPEVHTGFSSGVSASQLTFSGVSISGDWLTRGSQLAPDKSYTDNWYPNGMTNTGWRHSSSANGRYRNTVYSGIAGTMSGNQFTCTTTADARKFNGGDKVSTSIGSSTFISSVNYDTGVITVDGTASGAATISHTSAASFVGVSLSGFGTPEASVTAPMGSVYLNVAGGAGTTLYVKQSGTGNTGWVGK